MKSDMLSAFPSSEINLREKICADLEINVYQCSPGILQLEIEYIYTAVVPSFSYLLVGTFRQLKH